MENRILPSLKVALYKIPINYKGKNSNFTVKNPAGTTTLNG